MTDNLILMRNKDTGIVAKYPHVFLELFPNLECVETDQMCTDCVFVEEPETVELKEPTPRKRTSK